MVLPTILTMDVMIVNDVERAPTWLERILIVLMCTVFPAVITYFNIVHPLKSLRKKLIAALKLTEEIGDSVNKNFR